MRKFVIYYTAMLCFTRLVITF